MTFASTGSMLTPRWYHTATLLKNGKVLVAGGAGTYPPDNHIGLASAELYDPSTGQWTPTSSMRATKGGYQSATLLSSGKVLVAGDPASKLFDLATGKWVPTDKVAAELYDPSSGKWSPAGSVTMFGGVATLLPGGKVLVVEANGEVEGNLQVYDPVTNRWTTERTGIGPRGNLTATLLQTGKVLIAGGALWGVTDGLRSSAYLYDPATGRLSPTGHMTVERAGHTATLLRSGKVLVAGGFNFDAAASSAELYDPATGKWARTGDLVEPRSQHAATLLGDGKVLVIGGRDDSDGPIPSVELYDPDTGRWTFAGSLRMARRLSTATLLQDGKVLVAGGMALNADREFPAEAELGTYSPS